MPMTTNSIEALCKQAFIRDYILNGLFPCKSPILKMIRNNKRPWDYTDIFEYRMLLSASNTAGSLNSQVHKDTGALRRPGNTTMGIFKASYGTVTNGLTVDMMANLETANAKTAFARQIDLSMHTARMGIASTFKNFAIGGRFGVVHQIREFLTAPSVGAEYNPVANTFTPTLGVPFTIKTPSNVFMANFGRGTYFIKTTSPQPYGTANVAELYMVINCTLTSLTLIPVGTAVSEWKDGEFLEIAFNREIEGQPLDIFDNWSASAITVASGPFAGSYDRFDGTGAYTSGANAITGAMEGLADLLPWYTDPAEKYKRLGLELPFRGQLNRQSFTESLAGNFIVQKDGVRIIDAIMEGVALSKTVLPDDEVGVWMNPTTRMALGYEAGNDVKIIRDNMLAGPVFYQAGVTSTTYSFGTAQVKEVMDDANLPTDVVIIGPKTGLSYNCWDNPLAEIDKYITDRYGSETQPNPERFTWDKEFAASLDFQKRIIVGSPILRDGSLASFGNGNYIRHPQNIVPVVLQEMGALFTEYPYAYTIVKLQKPIVNGEWV